MSLGRKTLEAKLYSYPGQVKICNSFRVKPSMIEEWGSRSHADQINMQLDRQNLDKPMFECLRKCPQLNATYKGQSRRHAGLA
ncbi:hypothetical protein RRG08_021191 [Elysia crispata]|uniref:Uncharacterized protein n=1 Tax=Elysia crispata TaxID=231223 RepID=A0AAE1D2W2_9GAST|nr:hypothetical protein RRG08_021191 [Elysia crispata]